jgi:hypothetical protein
MPMMAIGVERDIWQAWGRVPLVAAECTPLVVVSDMVGCDAGERSASDVGSFSNGVNVNVEFL